jgi:hypothetical protein
MATAGNLKQASVLKKLRHHKAQRSTATKIKFLRGKLTRNSTTIVTVKNDEGFSVDITDKHKMEKAIIASSKIKFQQSFATPFYKQLYNRLFGYKGLTKSSSQVLDGTFVPPANASSHMRDFLAMPAVIKNNPNSMQLTLEGLISFWKKAKETTSCYPSKVSFSTLKARSFDTYLSNLDCIMTRIPLTTGYSPTRWRR